MLLLSNFFPNLIQKYQHCQLTQWQLLLQNRFPYFLDSAAVPSETYNNWRQIRTLCTPCSGPTSPSLATSTPDRSASTTSSSASRRKSPQVRQAIHLVLFLMLYSSALPNYRPQRSCGKVMFYTCLSFCPRGGGSAWVHAGIHPLGRYPPGRHPQADTFLSRPPLGIHPLYRHPPGQTLPPQQTATAVDGTHPTGMHSCLLYRYNPQTSWKQCNNIMLTPITYGITYLSDRY